MKSHRLMPQEQKDGGDFKIKPKNTKNAPKTNKKPQKIPLDNREELCYNNQALRGRRVLKFNIAE